MSYLLLVVGIVALIKGADLFVDGSANIAKKLRVPSVIIGLTIVSLGTSLPEASVSITASLAGSNDLAISNVTGSNIFNLMVVVGVCVLLKPMQSDKDLVRRDFPVAIAASVAMILFILDGNISRIEAAVFLVACAAYIVILIVDARKNQQEEEFTKIFPWWQSALFIVLGVGGIILGGNFVVSGAVDIARTFGLSETLIGLTIVSIGTSLPELVTSVVAARKGESGLALGNAVGSCILNIVFILGSSALLSPIAVAQDAIIHAGIMLATTVMMFVFVLTSKKVNRIEGAVCLLTYIGYMVYVVLF